MVVSVRPYRLADAEGLAEAARESTTEVFPWLPWCRPDFSTHDARQWLAEQEAAWAARRSFEFCVVDATGGFLGACGINQIHPLHRFANVGYWVRTSATARGVATAAVRQVVAFARSETDLVRLEIVVAVGNAASARVAEKVGARLEGVLENRLCLHGQACDAAMYGLAIRR